MKGFSFYNKISILIFSVLLTGFGGALMFAYNLRVSGKNKTALPLVLIALVANAVLRQLIKNVLPGSAIELFIPGAICGLILIFPVWDKYLGEFQDSQSKSILIPAIVTVVLYGGFILLGLFLKK